MAFLVARRPGQWEIRESVHTASGPRARTLATFRVLTDAVLEQAEAAAVRPFDREEVRASAWRAGVPLGEPLADRAARALLGEVAAGHLPAPGLRRLVVDRLTEAAPLPDLEAGGSASEWAGASLEERGETLRDLLELTDRLPAPRRGVLRFPRLTAARGD